MIDKAVHLMIGFMLAIGLSAGSAMAQGVYHNGYMRSDGTYVAPQPGPLLHVLSQNQDPSS
jgi:hypothetical protein